MSAAIDNLVQETSTTTGTGNFTVSAVDGRQTFFSAFDTGGTDVFYYFISHRTAAEWEIGTGHMSAATTLVRDTVIINHLGTTALINFTAGTKDVTNDAPAAQRLVDVLTTRGDLAYQGANQPQRLAKAAQYALLMAGADDPEYLVKGANGEDLQVVDGAVIWHEPSSKNSIGGLIPSNGTDANHDLDFTAGCCRDDANEHTISVAALTKRFDATWAVGNNNGGMASGSSLPVEGSVLVYAIRRSDTGVTDIIGIDVADLPLTLPPNYDSKRRIWAFTTDLSSNIVGFSAFEYFGGAVEVYLDSPVRDLNGNVGTTATNLTTSVPQGVEVIGMFNVCGRQNVTVDIYLSGRYQDNDAASGIFSTVELESGNTTRNNAEKYLRTNTDGEVRLRATTTTVVRFRTQGWWDVRRD